MGRSKKRNRKEKKIQYEGMSLIKTPVTIKATLRTVNPRVYASPRPAEATERRYVIMMQVHDI